MAQPVVIHTDKPRDGSRKTQHSKSKKKVLKRADGSAVKEVLISVGARSAPAQRTSVSSRKPTTFRLVVFVAYIYYSMNDECPANAFW